MTDITPMKPDFIFYQTEDGQTRVQVRVHDEAVWLSLNQMADLFQRDKSVISKHIKNVFDEDELDQHSVVAKFATTAADGENYQVGYRFKSHWGTQFRICATQKSA